MDNNNVKSLLTATNLGMLSWTKTKSFTKIPTIKTCFLLSSSYEFKPYGAFSNLWVVNLFI